MTTNPIIIKSTSEGVLTLLNAKPVYRLSSSKNTQYLYAPFSLTNTIKVGFLLANGVNVPFRKTTPSSSATLQALIDTGEIPEDDVEESFLLWEYAMPQSILNAVAQKNASEFITSYTESEIVADTDYLGYYTTTSEVVATINAELKVEFPTATTGQWSNVWQETSNTFFSWLFDGTDFIKQTSVLNEQFIGTTGQLTLSVNPSVSSDDEQIDITVTDIVFDELSQLWAIVTALTGDVTDLMQIDDYDTEGLATESVKYARNVGVDGASKSASDIIAGRFLTIDLGDGSGPGQLTYDTTNRVASIDYDNGVSIQLGEESMVQSVNKEGTNITEGKPVSFTGATGNSPQFVLAKNTDDDLAHKTVGLTTEDIDNNLKGKVTTFGLVRGLDTSAWSEGDFLYVGVGVLTNVKPTKPTPVVEIGIVVIDSPTAGAIFVSIDKAHKLDFISDVDTSGSVEGDMLRKNASAVYEATDPEQYLMSRDIQNGAFKETFDLLYSAGVMVLTNADGVTNSLTMQFSDGDTALDTTSLSLAPTFGSTTVPVKNYFYILQSAKVLAVGAGWPSGEHIRVAEVTVLDLTLTNTEGPLGNQNHNNHEMDNVNLIGSLNHIRESIRERGALWRTGVAGATAGEWVKDTAGTLDFTSTAGTVRQLHEQVYTAKDTSVADDIHLVNDFTAPYKEIASLDLITTFSDGVAIGNEYFNVFVYGVINKSGEYSPLMVNTPTEGYNNLTDAQTDLDSTLVTTVPVAFRNTAFAIARLLLRKVGATYSFIQSYDLREEKFGIGGTTGTGTLDGEFIDSTFELQNVSDTSKIMKFSAGNQTTSTTRTVTMADTDIDLADIVKKVEKDLTNNTNYVPLISSNADGLEVAYLYDVTNDTYRKMSLDEIAAFANTATGSFVASADYSGDGLGANFASFVKLHTLLLNANGYQTYVDIKAPLTGQIIYVTFPTMTSTTVLELSTDNESTYADVLSNGNTVQAQVYSEQIVELRYDGTNWIVLKGLANPQAISYGGTAESTFGVLSPIDGSPQINEILSVSAEQILPNGDFASGITNWTDVNSTLVDNAGDTITATLTDVSGGVLQAVLTTGAKYHLVARIKPSTTGNITLGDTATNYGTTANEWNLISRIYTATGANARLYLSGIVGDTLEIDYYMAIPLDNKPYENDTLAQLNNRFPTYLAYGFTDIDTFELDTIGVNINSFKDISQTGRLDSNSTSIIGYLPCLSSVDYVGKIFESELALGSNDRVGFVQAQYIDEYTTATDYINAGLDRIDLGATGEDTITTDASTNYLVLFVYDKNANDNVYNDIQLEQGTSASSTFVEFNSATDNFSIPNGISVGTSQDRVYPDNDRWLLERKNDIDTTVLKGATFTFLTTSTIYSAFQVDLTSTLGYKVVDTLEVANIDLVIDAIKFPSVQRSTFLDNAEVVYTKDTGELVLWILTSKSGVTSGSLTTYLSGVDVTFRFELATADDPVEIDQDGNLVQESVTTLIQKQDIGQDYTIEFVLDNDKQIGVLIDGQAVIKKEVGLLEDNVATLQTDVTAIEVKTDFIQISQNVNLDTVESDTVANTASSFTDAVANEATDVTITKKFSQENDGFAMIQFTLTYDGTIAGGGTNIVATVPSPAVQVNLVSIKNNVMESVGSAFINTSGQIKTNTGGVLNDEVVILMTGYAK